VENFEKLGAFYLGRPYDLERKQLRDGITLYDSKDLVTHAVCVGMTGSGKTGLCVGLLEEAAIDAIPSIVIDPKGDLSNMLLTFPELDGKDFEPWINEDDARKQSLSNAEYAKQQGTLWTKGLGDWGQDGNRIRRLREAADFVIYTPGSAAGIPVSILKSFDAPSTEVLDDRELLKDRINTTVTSLLGLLGIVADPIQSREHILISTILGAAWSSGENVDLPMLIARIQSPPMTKIGVLDLESFYPAKERFSLVMALNNLLASPGFGTWLEGEPLDIGSLLHSKTGKPRVSIFSIAHLSDSERMFFVSLLLNQVLGWMRSQSGTTSLRAILFMDEIFGYFPPVANPPSKLPLLTLLKQARAYGLGLVLATQNPVDLDYKGLANTGTWFIGRLQTERDKQRVLEGLEGAMTTQGSNFDREAIGRTLASLGNRVFLMNNTHEDAPEIFQTRWTLSYLRGPLTRNQIKILMEPQKTASATQTSTSAAEKTSAGSILPSSQASRAAIPPDVPQFFVPVRAGAPPGSVLVYRPLILGSGKVSFTDVKSGVDESQDVCVWTAVSDQPVPLLWAESEEAGVAATDLEKEGISNAQFEDLPPAASKAKSYADWRKEFAAWLYGSQKLELMKSPTTGEFSKPGETERDFRVRLQHAMHEHRDQMVNELRQKFAPKIATLEARIVRAQQSVQRENSQAGDQQFQTAISFGTTLLGAVFGRKVLSSSTLNRASTAARSVSRAMKERQDVSRAQESVGSLQDQLNELETLLQSEIQLLETQMTGQSEQLEVVTIKPKKTNISVQLVALAWRPFWRDAANSDTPAWT